MAVLRAREFESLVEIRPIRARLVVALRARLTPAEYVGEASVGERGEERVPVQLEAARRRARDAGEEACLLSRRGERVGMVRFRPGYRKRRPTLGSNGSTRGHNAPDTTHGATAIGTPPSLTTNTDGVRRQGGGPFIPIRSLKTSFEPVGSYRKAFVPREIEDQIAAAPTVLRL